MREVPQGHNQGELPRNKPELAKKPDIIITGEDILAVLTSDQFRTGVNTTVKRLRKVAQGMESGFTIMRGITTNDMRLIYADDVEQGSTGYSDKTRECLYKLYAAGKFPIVSLHFHPHDYTNPAFTYTPSDGDLETMSARREKMQHELHYDGYPLSVIGIVRGKANLDLVLYQETPRAITNKAMMRQYGQDTNSNETTADVLSLLDNYGYKAAIVGYNNNQFSPAASEKIKTFGYTLTPFQPKSPKT